MQGKAPEVTHPEFDLTRSSVTSITWRKLFRRRKSLLLLLAFHSHFARGTLKRNAKCEKIPADIFFPFTSGSIMLCEIFEQRYAATEYLPSESSKITAHDGVDIGGAVPLQIWTIIGAYG